MLGGPGGVPPGGGPSNSGSASMSSSEVQKQQLVQILSAAKTAIVTDVRAMIAGRKETNLERTGPEMIGPYRNLGLIGRGGMKDVYLANDVDHGYVTLQVPNDEVKRSPELLARFRREVKTLFAVQNPNTMTVHYAELGSVKRAEILKIFRQGDDSWRNFFINPDRSDFYFSSNAMGLLLSADIDDSKRTALINILRQKEDGIYFVAEYIRGVDLDKLIKEKGKLPLDQALAIFYWALQGLSQVHKKGGIHRDLKPENFMITEDGIVKIVDFGLGKPGEVSFELTGAGSMMGTPTYWPPEILTVSGSSKNIDYKGDIYALGLVLYEMLTGALPRDFSISEESKKGIMDFYVYASGAESFLQSVDFNSLAVPQKVKPALVDLIQRTTEKDPAKRLCDHRQIKQRVLGILLQL